MKGRPDVATSLSARIHDALPKTQYTYYELILAVGPARAGKTAALRARQEIAESVLIE